MSVTQKLVTKNLNVHSAKQFVESFTEDSKNRYYVYFARHIPYADGDTVQVASDSLEAKVTDVYNNMVFAKQVQSTDVVHMIPRYDWEANTVYAEYTHTDGNLYSKNFYIVVDDVTEKNVYKCLYNNSNTVSTIAPMRVGSTADLNPIYTGDGYVWKYMYTITKTNFDKFATNDYVPVTSNTSVITGATPGTVELIKVTSGGAKYDNYIANGVFRTGDIAVGGINTIYGAPETADAHDDFYQGCVIKITSGAGIDQYRKIVNYAGTGFQKLFTLDSAFTVTPAVNDTYEVYPYVFVWGDGSEDLPADGRAIINTNGNSVSSVEMLSVGQGYRSGEAYVGKTPNTALASITSAYIDVPSLVKDDPDFEEATTTPIISPTNGHGSDPLNELGGNRVCISVKVTDSEGGLLPTENDFRQVGLIKDPLYNRSILNLEQPNTIGNFTIGETVYQVKQYKLLGNVETSTTSNVVTKSNFGKISSTITVLNGGTGYNTGDTALFDNTGTGGSGAAATVTVTANAVASLTVSNTGSGYISAPTLTIVSSAGSNAQVSVALANPQKPTFKDAFSANDLILINSGTQNQITTVSSVPFDYQIILSENAAFTATNAEISAFKVTGTGIVSSISTGVIELTNTDGIFTAGSRVIGLDSSATSIISVSNNNGRGTTFSTPIQLTKLTGNFSAGTSLFEEDEQVRQLSLFTSLANVALVVGYQPRGYLHHAEIGASQDDDSLFISNEYGIFNLDINGIRSVSGVSTEATFDKLSARQPGDFVKDSGEVLYYENLDPISRGSNKSEVIKLILEF